MNAKKYPLVYSQFKFCANCGFPNKTSTHQEIVEDYIEDIFNLDGPQIIYRWSSANCRWVILLCQVFDRQQKRINGEEKCT